MLPKDFCAWGNGADWVDQKGNITALEYIPLSKLRRHTPDWENDKGTPTGFTVEGPSIYLYPAPNKPGTFRLSYVPLPNELSVDLEQPFYGDPRFNGYGDLIVYRAAWDLLMKDRDFEMADRIQRMYQSRYVDFMESLRKTPDKINTTWDVGYYGYESLR